MRRRSYNVTTLAAAFATLPSQSTAQQSEGNRVGHQVAVTNDGLSIVLRGGMARPRVSDNDDTLFQVTPCSKTVTSLAVLTLARDGHLSLDAPVNQYLRRWQVPGLRGNMAANAELLSHTVGTSIHGFVGYISFGICRIFLISWAGVRRRIPAPVGPGIGRFGN